MPLWALLIASQGADYVQWVLGLFEEYSRAQLHSHSLPSVAAGATLLALAYGVRSSDWAGARLIAALYASHMLLDLVTGVKVLWPGTPKIGACLYERPGLDFALESGVATKSDGRLDGNGDARRQSGDAGLGAIRSPPSVACISIRLQRRALQLRLLRTAESLQTKAVVKTKRAHIGFDLMRNVGDLKGSALLVTGRCTLDQ